MERHAESGNPAVRAAILQFSSVMQHLSASIARGAADNARRTARPAARQPVLSSRAAQEAAERFPEVESPAMAQRLAAALLAREQEAEGGDGGGMSVLDDEGLADAMALEEARGTDSVAAWVRGSSAEDSAAAELARSEQLRSEAREGAGGAELAEVTFAGIPGGTIKKMRSNLRPGMLLAVVGVPGNGDGGGDSGGGGGGGG